MSILALFMHDYKTIPSRFVNWLLEFKSEAEWSSRKATWVVADNPENVQLVCLSLIQLPGSFFFFSFLLLMTEERFLCDSITIANYGIWDCRFER